MALATGVGLALRGSKVMWQVPLAMPHLTMAVVVVHLLAPSGVVARMVYAVGGIGGPGSFRTWCRTGGGWGSSWSIG